jgi:hypothetical protein
MCQNLDLRFLLIYCLLMLVFSLFLFTLLSPFCVSVFYCLFPFFCLVFYCPSFFLPSFSPLFVYLFFGSYEFHLYPTTTCLGLKGLVVVVVVGLIQLITLISCCSVNYSACQTHAICHLYICVLNLTIFLLSD